MEYRINLMGLNSKVFLKVFDIKKLSYWFFQRSRHVKASILIGMDTVFSVLALWMAFSLRLGEMYLPVNYTWVLFCISPALIVPIFIKMGLYRAIIRYIGGRALLVIFQAVTLYALAFTVIVFLFGVELGLVPRTVPVINWLLLLLLVGGSRFIARWWLSSTYLELGGQVAKDYCVKKVIIYGAGSAGAQLASALECGQDYKAVAFIDDNKLLHRQKLNGLRVYPITSLQYLIDRHEVADVFLAMPSVKRGRRNKIIKLLEPYSLHVKSMPGLADIAKGKIKFDELQDVDIVDLLGREAVEPNQALFHANIAEKVVMVTGAGGSIGFELCRQIIQLQPAKIILFELNEFALYSVDKEINSVVAKLDSSFDVVSLLGSVTDEVRLKKICVSFGVQTIYHAAAYKHVPVVEENPGEAIKNNVFGTLSLAQAAIFAKVETFVLISTDKAVRPTNTMGASKRCAELVLQGLSLEKDHDTRFTMVRFGNVLGSSGSVIPLFREQIARGGPVTVTDKRVSRYFMTIPEAAQLVIQAGAMGQGGDVFVLDMGDSIRIVDLAKRMIHLSGLEVKDEEHPDGEVEIIYTGLRPGEKLYEELLINEGVLGTAHSRILRAEEDVVPWKVLDKRLKQLMQTIGNDEFEEMREILKDLVLGYVPQCEVNDLLWKNKL